VADAGSYTLPGARGGSYSGDHAAVQLGIRPEHITFCESGSGQCDGVVDVVEYLGADTFVIVDCGELGQVTVRVLGDGGHAPGDTVGLGFATEALHFFDVDGLAVRS